MLRLLLILVLCFTSLCSFAAEKTNKTCLELNVGSGDEAITEYIYIDNNSKEVIFANSKAPANVITYNDEIIKFSTSYPAPNDKGWTIEAIYEINRYTGGCNITYINKATSLGEKIDAVLFDAPNKHIYNYTGSARKINASSQKF